MALSDDVRAMREELRELRDEVRALNRVGETYKLELQKHEEQLNGKQGVFSLLVQLSEKVASLTKGAYVVALSIIGGAIAFAFSVLQLVH